MKVQSRKDANMNTNMKKVALLLLAIPMTCNAEWYKPTTWLKKSEGVHRDQIVEVLDDHGYPQLRRVVRPESSPATGGKVILMDNGQYYSPGQIENSHVELKTFRVLDDDPSAYVVMTIPAKDRRTPVQKVIYRVVHELALPSVPYTTEPTQIVGYEVGSDGPNLKVLSKFDVSMGRGQFISAEQAMDLIKSPPADAKLVVPDATARMLGYQEKLQADFAERYGKLAEKRPSTEISEAAHDLRGAVRAAK
jgi:hypothetical protein